jgi:actin-related protein
MKYVLPDKREVKIEGHARFISPEILFQPEIGQGEGPSIQQQIWDSISSSDVNMRECLGQTLLVSGGSSKF